MEETELGERGKAVVPIEGSISSFPMRDLTISSMALLSLGQFYKMKIPMYLTKYQ